MSRCNPHALSRYIDGELSLPRRREVSEHLRSCSECSQEVEALYRVDRTLRSWGTRRRSLGLDVEKKIHGAVERRRHLRPIFAVSRMMPAAVGSSAAALLLLMTANLGWLYQSKTAPLGPSSATPRQLAKQSAGLTNTRRTFAITAGRPVAGQKFVSTRHTALETKYLILVGAD